MAAILIFFTLPRNSLKMSQEKPCGQFYPSPYRFRLLLLELRICFDDPIPESHDSGLEMCFDLKMYM